MTDDYAFEQILEGWPHLRELKCYGCSCLSDYALYLIEDKKRCPNLESCYLFWCKSISEYAAKRLRKARPGLRLRISIDCGELIDRNVFDNLEDCEEETGPSFVAELLELYLSELDTYIGRVETLL